jgi:hypothetical protein
MVVQEQNVRHEAKHTFKSILMNNEAFKLQLVAGSAQNLGLYRVGGGKSKHNNGLCLANTMATILGLQIHLRVPVRIINDNRIGSRQVDTEASCSG